MFKRNFGNHYPVFIHIEKAGGMTMHHILNANDVGYASLSPVLHKHGVNWEEAQNRSLKRIFPILSGIGGHRVRPWLDYLETGKTPFYMTFVRQPYERYLSHFRYQVAIMGVPWTIESFLEDETFSNFQVKKIAGSNDLEKAKSLLVEKFNFVGLLEAFDESLIYMNEAMQTSSLDIRYKIVNQNVKKPKSSITLSPEIKSQILERNDLDIQLYDFVQNEIFNSYQEKWGSDIQLKSFQNSLVNYEWPKMAQMTWRVKSILIRRILQNVASGLNK